MLTKEQYEHVKKNSQEGRGLWLGLFVDRTELAPDWLDLLHCDDGGTAHITIAHLGKHTSPQMLQRAAEMEGSRHPFPIVAELTGIGTLFRWKPPHTEIALVNSAAICEMWYLVREHLGISDKKYGFIPHITRPGPGGHFFHKPQKITFEQLEIVCGDARYPL